MFANDVLTQIDQPAPWLGAGAEPLSSRTWDAEDGPIDIGDPTEGLSYQQWRAYIKKGKVYLQAGDSPATPLIEPDDGTVVTDISIAFNQNAYFYYVWVDSNNVARFYWFNTQKDGGAGPDVMTLPAGTRSPKVTLDDKRPSQSGRSDVILSYVNADNELCYRMQRELFDVEHVIDEGPILALEQLYMSTEYRLQWLVTRAVPI